ncbi:MAG: GGDEF domain-containing protein [Candidatus Omnitrophica bacterium]|nr:GGDEF domain-containing protein [Candidatus Omnitrophota bacterium]
MFIIYAGIFLIVIFTFLLSVAVKYGMRLGYEKLETSFLNLQSEYNSVRSVNKTFKKEKNALQNELDETIALYDITKQICKSLDETGIFSYFDGLVHKYIRVKNCRFVKGEISEQEREYGDVLPLEVGKKIIGYLVCEGLRDEDRDKFHILAHQFLLGLKRAILYAKVQELVITDSLTNVLSRRYWLERFTEEIERSRKFNYKLSCFMLDIDHFKKINDHYGHMVGEVILKEVAKAIKDSIRQIDLVGRYGGEEFSVFLAETAKEEAYAVAERIRSSIENKLIRAYDEELQVTISIGISMFPEHGPDGQNLLVRADEALYQAKKTGRNRVCISSA